MNKTLWLALLVSTMAFAADPDRAALEAAMHRWTTAVNSQDVESLKATMTEADKAIHDTLCTTEGAKAKDGEGRCPVMLYAKRNSHMSEVFSFDSPDKSVSDPVLAFVKNAVKK